MAKLDLGYTMTREKWRGNTRRRLVVKITETGEVFQGFTKFLESHYNTTGLSFYCLRRRIDHADLPLSVLFLSKEDVEKYRVNRAYARIQDGWSYAVSFKKGRRLLTVSFLDRSVTHTVDDWADLAARSTGKVLSTQLLGFRIKRDYPVDALFVGFTKTSRPWWWSYEQLGIPESIKSEVLGRDFSITDVRASFLSSSQRLAMAFPPLLVGKAYVGGVHYG